MAKSQAASAPERYEDIIRRLDEVVKLLESSEVPCKACGGSGTVDGRACAVCDGEGHETLPLDESLKAFEEGIGLVRRGEAKLSEAEKRVEVLLKESTDEREPFDAERPRAETARPDSEGGAPAPSERGRPRKPPLPEEDIPF